jgi:hypothetical protein
MKNQGHLRTQDPGPHKIFKRTISFLDLLLGKLPLKQKQTNNFPNPINWKCSLRRD